MILSFLCVLERSLGLAITPLEIASIALPFFPWPLNFFRPHWTLLRSIALNTYLDALTNYNNQEENASRGITRTAR